MPGSKVRVQNVFLEIVKVTNDSLLLETALIAMITRREQLMEDPATCEFAQKLNF